MFPPSPFPRLTKADRRLINRIRWARQVLASADPTMVALAVQIERLSEDLPARGNGARSRTNDTAKATAPEPHWAASMSAGLAASLDQFLPPRRAGGKGEPDDG
jgi:hypothetical protein